MVGRFWWPCFWVVLSYWSLFYGSTRSDWPSLSAEKHQFVSITFSSMDTFTKLYYLTVFKHFTSNFLLDYWSSWPPVSLVLVVDSHLLVGMGNWCCPSFWKIYFHHCKHVSPQICFPIANSLFIATCLSIYFFLNLPMPPPTK